MCFPSAEKQNEGKQSSTKELTNNSLLDFETSSNYFATSYIRPAVYIRHRPLVLLELHNF